MDKNKGFTFIEILVVIVIIVIFSGLSLAYYNDFNGHNLLKSEANRMVDVLELAKKSSAAGLNANTCPSGFAGYRVDIGQNSYTLSLCCTNSCPVSPPVQTYNFPTNISVPSIFDRGYITFKQLTAGLDSNKSTPVIRLKNSSLNVSSNCLRILYNIVGTFSIESTFTSC